MVVECCSSLIVGKQKHSKGPAVSGWVSIQGRLETVLNDCSPGWEAVMLGGTAMPLPHALPPAAFLLICFLQTRGQLLLWLKWRVLGAGESKGAVQIAEGTHAMGWVFTGMVG